MENELTKLKKSIEENHATIEFLKDKIQLRERQIERHVRGNGVLAILYIIFIVLMIISEIN